jgi:hypothetical protein
MIEIISYILLGWGYLTLWFFAVGTYLRLERSGEIRNMPSFIYWSLYIMLIPGVILDFLSLTQLTQDISNEHNNTDRGRC